MSGLVPFNRRKSDLSATGFEDFYNMLDDFFADGWPGKRSLSSDTFKVDVREEDSGYVVEADLPGVKKEELNISLDDNRLSITVARDEKVEENKKNYLHRERRYCSMQRSIFLADSDAEGIKATLKDGELTITIPKKQKVDTSIQIEVE